MGGPYGLDMGTVMAMAQARECDLNLLSDVLPGFEQAILDGLADEEAEFD